DPASHKTICWQSHCRSTASELGRIRRRVGTSAKDCLALRKPRTLLRILLRLRSHSVEASPSRNREEHRKQRDRSLGASAQDRSYRNSRSFSRQVGSSERSASV